MHSVIIAGLRPPRRAAVPPIRPPNAKTHTKTNVSQMNYAYIRVSSDRQTTKNQRFEISSYAESRGMKIDRWIDETASSRRALGDRKLGGLLKRLGRGDTLVVSEISRLGRNLMQIMVILNFCMERFVKIIAVKENYELGDNINSKVLAFAFGLSAEIERNLISQRTKEALARRRADGLPLGRPKGSSAKRLKLSGKEELIEGYIRAGLSKSEISRKLNVCIRTLSVFLNRGPERQRGLR